MKVMDRKRKREREVGDDGLERMTIWEHIDELRSRVIKSVLAIGCGAVVGFFLWDPLLAFMQRPYCDLKRERIKDAASAVGTCKFVAFEPLELVTTRLKVASYIGLVLALPIVLWQLWRFITPGLHPKEKKYAVPFIAASIFLFLLGGAIAVLTFPQALEFLIDIGGNNVETLFGPSKYISLYVLIMLAFGLAFEFPVVLTFLQIANIVKPRQLFGWWRYAIVVIFIVAAVITPSQDPYSLLGMALPMVCFYFMSAGIGKLLGK